LALSYSVGFDMFRNTPWSAFLAMFFTFGFSINSIGFFLAAVSPSIKSGYTVAYSFILLCFVVNGIATVPMASYAFYIKNIHSEVLKIVIKLLEFYPGFEFSKMWTDISSVAADHYDVVAGKYFEGATLNWSKLSERSHLVSQMGMVYDVPSFLTSALQMWKTSLIFLVLTWYFDHVGENNRGAAKGFLFFLGSDYWKSIFPVLRRKRSVQSLGYRQPSEADQMQDSSVEAEKSRVQCEWESGRETKGIVCAGISKTFKKGLSFLGLGKDFHALQDVSSFVSDSSRFTLKRKKES
jgi:hypothetical protein